MRGRHLRIRTIQAAEVELEYLGNHHIPLRDNTVLYNIDVHCGRGCASWYPVTWEAYRKWWELDEQRWALQDWRRCRRRGHPNPRWYVSPPQMPGAGLWGPGIYMHEPIIDEV